MILVTSGHLGALHQKTRVGRLMVHEGFLHQKVRP